MNFSQLQVVIIVISRQKSSSEKISSRILPDSKLQTLSKPTGESHFFPLVGSRLKKRQIDGGPKKVQQNGGKVMLSDANGGYPSAGNC